MGRQSPSSKPAPGRIKLNNKAQDQQVKVSIVILTWNSERHIAACLASLEQGLSKFSSEAIVIDNDSRDSTCAIIEKTWPGVRLERNSENRGVAPARNQGIRMAAGDYVLVLDDDTVVQAGALDCMVRYMEDQPEVGLCGPKLTDADGKLQLSCRQFPTLMDKLARRLPSFAGRRMTRTVEMAHWDHGTVRAVDYVIGACQMMRRRALEEVGLFDERIFYGPEDIDICLRLRKAGWLVVYHPEAVVVHDERRLTRSLRSELSWKHVWALGYFFYKHGYLLSRRRLYAQLPEVKRRSGPEAASPTRQGLQQSRRHGNMDKVSVVIPSYNSSAYITRAVESALNQSYDNLEVIVSDDVSTDDTRDLVRNIGDPRVSLLEHTQKNSAASARNSAIEVASGRYIAFLDSDDYWLPDKLSAQIGRMQAAAKSFSYTSFIAKSKAAEVLIDVPEQVDYKTLLKGNIIGTSTVVYDAGALGKIYMPALRMTEDYATWLNILRQCGAALGVREPLTYYTMRGDSLSSRFVPAVYFNYQVYRKTQDLSPVMSLYYLSRNSLRALRKHLRYLTSHW